MAVAHPPPPALASPARRLGGWAIEFALLAAVWLLASLILFPLMDGAAEGMLIAPAIAVAVWLLWLLRAAPRGQTPGKQLLGLYVVRADGSVAGFGHVLLREVAIKGVGLWLSTAVTFGLAWALAALWCLWDKDRQCLWDKVAGTRVVHAGGAARADDRP